MTYRIHPASMFVISFLVFALAAQGTVFAHFIWVAKSKESGRVQIFFGEGPHPGNAKLLDRIEGMRVWSLDKDFKPTEIKFSKQTKDDEGWFDCILDSESNSGLEAVDCDCNYGVFSRGEKSMLLHYTAKYLDLESGNHTRSSGQLPLDITIESRGESVNAKVVFRGKPVVNSEVSIVDEQGKEKKVQTDSKGVVNLAHAQPGRYLLRAKTIEEQGGELDGKSYSEKVFYCTLTLDHGVPSTVTSAKVSKRKIADLPVGITSFGGARIGNQVYLYGGHRGNAHEYYDTVQNQVLYALDLEDASEWKEIGKGPGLQGLAVVAHGDDLYRLGGFNARNAEGEDADLHSVTDFAVFNFDSKDWEMLTPMPTARSSFDAVVVGDTLYVVGGWELNGENESNWSESAISIDLSQENPKWETLTAPPFERRAVSVGYQDDHLIVIGGIQPEGGPTRDVSILDLKTGKWADGPTLPGSEGMEGFGTSCFNIGGSLVVSTIGGNVYRLDESQKSWEAIHKCDNGRFFHRLLPVSDHEFALFGGANMESGKAMNVEVFDLD